MKRRVIDLSKTPHTMKIMAVRAQLDLVQKVNTLFNVGDKIRVGQADDSPVIYTMKAPASMMDHKAVIWVKEKRNGYPADRVNFVRTCRSCGCCDLDCMVCIDAQGFPCHWVEDRLCSRCKAEQEQPTQK